MWLLLAFLSMTLLGFYDVFKKMSLNGNDVVTVLFLNTLFCALIFLPALLSCPFAWHDQLFIVLKSIIVLSSWLLGYIGIKHLPITIVGPINATRPVMVLMGALLLFGERLNLCQWIGVLLAMFSFFLLSKSGKREGIDFRHNKWIACVVLSAVIGAGSGLYDKFIMAPPSEGGIGLDRTAVQSWNNLYQSLLMGLVWLATHSRTRAKFHWHWAIVGISLFISAADFAYFYALSLNDAMISIVSMVRRGSVIVSFIFGAMAFRERNLRAKAIDLALVLVGMIFLYLGSR